jgi:hypothetical protein
MPTNGVSNPARPCSKIGGAEPGRGEVGADKRKKERQRGEISFEHACQLVRSPIKALFQSEDQ